MKKPSNVGVSTLLDVTSVDVRTREKNNLPESAPDVEAHNIQPEESRHGADVDEIGRDVAVEWFTPRAVESINRHDGIGHQEAANVPHQNFAVHVLELGQAGVREQRQGEEDAGNGDCDGMRLYLHLFLLTFKADERFEPDVVVTIINVVEAVLVTRDGLGKVPNVKFTSVTA